MKRIWFSLMAFGVFYNTAWAQVTITQKAGESGSSATNVSDTGILLKLEAGEDGGALLLPRLTDAQKEAMGIDLPEGMFIYDKDKHRLELFVEKEGGEENEGEWKSLGFGADLEPTCEWVQITNAEIGTGAIDGTTKEFTLNVTGKKPCIRNKGKLEVTEDATTGGKPGTKLVYQGLTLNPNTDYDISIEKSSGSDDKVKITFKTLVPESFSDFDVFMVAYRS